LSAVEKAFASYRAIPPKKIKKLAILVETLSPVQLKFSNRRCGPRARVQGFPPHAAGRGEAYSPVVAMPFYGGVTTGRCPGKRAEDGQDEMALQRKHTKMRTRGEFSTNSRGNFHSFARISDGSNTLIA
jgi:hypothetical protein